MLFPPSKGDSYNLHGSRKWGAYSLDNIPAPAQDTLGNMIVGHLQSGNSSFLCSCLFQRVRKNLKRTFCSHYANTAKTGFCCIEAQAIAT